MSQEKMGRKKRLLYITNSISGSGGLERVLSIKLSYLTEELDYEIYVIVLNNGDQNPFYEFSEKIVYFSIAVGGNPVKYILSFKNGIQKIVNELNPDIILVCDDGLKGFILPSIINTSAKWIYERHVSKLIEANDSDSVLKKIINKVKWSLMDFFGSRFDKFVVLTDNNKKEWKSLNNLTVISNPLSFYPDNKSSLQNKEIICVGKISYQKGQDLLLKAWEKISLKYPGWVLKLYGKRDNFFLSVDDLPEGVLYYPPTNDIESSYLSSSIYVMSSRFEGFGMVLIEAMACGVPCVSFDCDYGPSDIIRHGHDGLLVPKGDVHLLESSISSLIEDEKIRRELGGNARESVKRYQVKNIISEWNSLFNKLLK